LDKANVSDVIACPSVNDLMANHCQHNLEKACLELQELCLCVYATLQTEEEKKLYNNAVAKLIR
jgi:hypothetical protein